MSKSVLVASFFTPVSIGVSIGDKKKNNQLIFLNVTWDIKCICRIINK